MLLETPYDVVEDVNSMVDIPLPPNPDLYYDDEGEELEISDNGTNDTNDIRVFGVKVSFTLYNQSINQ